MVVVVVVVAVIEGKEITVHNSKLKGAPKGWVRKGSRRCETPRTSIERKELPRGQCSGDECTHWRGSGALPCAPHPQPRIWVMPGCAGHMWICGRHGSQLVGGITLPSGAAAGLCGLGALGSLGICPAPNGSLRHCGNTLPLHRSPPASRPVGGPWASRRQWVCFLAASAMRQRGNTSPPLP